VSEIVSREELRALQAWAVGREAGRFTPIVRTGRNREAGARAWRKEFRKVYRKLAPQGNKMLRRALRRR